MSTNSQDDSDVVEKETIIVTMGTLVNATTDVTDVTLNLISDDNPTVTSVAADKLSISENALMAMFQLLQLQLIMHTLKML